ncbi:hypothetical protein [Fulvivirga ligni]|uniref:hypothetical protein n=1 Tax=Fulvivirga ligni TaxID=2904246 RepID=UPI001F2A9F00|nr:hypothetical protein [Fulvivirga ligni]UII19145.1 hypothetical protein LVD16_14970 [Fulvivirga ligni]
MLRFLKRAAIVILLLLLILYLFLTIRQTRSYRHIPENADVIVRVNIDQIIKKLALNAIGHPSYYFGESAPDSTDTDEDEDIPSFNIPANLFIYNLNNAPDAYFTSLKIKDSVNIKSFLQNRLSIDHYEFENEYIYGYSKDHLLQLVFNDDRLFVAISLNKDNVKVILADLLLETERKDASNYKIERLKATNSDIIALSDSSEITGTFKNGSLEIKANLFLQRYLQFNTSNPIRKTNRDSVAHIWFSGRPTIEAGKTFEWNSTIFSWDSLLSYYDDYIDLEVKGQTTQSDTIITYEFNDDFEKVETAEIITDTVPSLDLMIKTKGNQLLNYLEDKLVVTNGVVNRDFFPLYQLNATQTGEYLHIGNTKNFPTGNIVSTDIIGIDANFKKIDTKKILNNSFGHISSVRIFGSLNSASPVNMSERFLSLTGEIKMKETDVNAFIQFIK